MEELCLTTVCYLSVKDIVGSVGATRAAGRKQILWSTKSLRCALSGGLDFSMDYADRAGNVFEVLHWEYDGFDFDEVAERKHSWNSGWQLLIGTMWRRAF